MLVMNGDKFPSKLRITGHLNFENAHKIEHSFSPSVCALEYFRFTFHLSKTEYDTLLQTIGTNNLKGHVTDFNHIFEQCTYVVSILLIHRFLLLQMKVAAFSFGSIAIIL